MSNVLYWNLEESSENAPIYLYICLIEKNHNLSHTEYFCHVQKSVENNIVFLQSFTLQGVSEYLPKGLVFSIQKAENKFINGK